MEKKDKKIDPKLINAADSARCMLMDRGYFVRNVLLIEENIIDVIALREGLVNSEKIRVRLIVPNRQGGLGTIPIKTFFREQSMVHDVKGFLISLGPISLQAKRLVEKENLNVLTEEWLKGNSNFDKNREISDISC
jgi:hypothetical protein